MTLSLTIQEKLVWWGPKQKQKNKPIAMLDSGPCDWLVPLLPTPTIQPVVNGIRLRFRRAYDSDFRFSLGALTTQTSTPSLVKTNL